MSAPSSGTVFLRPEARARHLEPLVELQRVRMEYPVDAGAPRVAIADMSLGIARGELVAVLGTAGSGRSTLMHLIAGLERPTRGRIFLDGADLAAFSDPQLDALRCRTIGIVRHAPFLLAEFSVAENVAMPMLLAGATDRAAAGGARALLDRHGLAALADQRVDALDREQRQRVSIVRALANDPLLLLADEPTALLTSDAAGRLAEFLLSLHRNGLTIVYATGDPSFALRAPRRLHLDDGRIVREEEDHA